eukprot:TRINITY_DN734_c0_g1_i2.p1 TRINITY_DN734_c0_g1~~TRINITY_DN734_c0_g1_i2.p1  ORF type:complete len:251 (+),score=21.49 TRINITY_DN734_c0_g1_i2:203-955(+)
MPMSDRRLDDDRQMIGKVLLQFLVMLAAWGACMGTPAVNDFMAQSPRVLAYPFLCLLLIDVILMNLDYRCAGSGWWIPLKWGVIQGVPVAVVLVNGSAFSTAMVAVFLTWIMFALLTLACCPQPTSFGAFLQRLKTAWNEFVMPFKAVAGTLLSGVGIYSFGLQTLCIGLVLIGLSVYIVCHKISRRPSEHLGCALVAVFIMILYACGRNECLLQDICAIVVAINMAGLGLLRAHSDRTPLLPIHNVASG